MNQQKIGNFIKEKRKEQNLTQEELASKLRVSNRTISKWENGHGMPDYSMILELCKILDMSINELLSGEEIKQENYQTMLEENMLKTIDYNNKKRNKNNIKIALIIILVLLSLALATYRAFLVYKYTSFNELKEYMIDKDKNVMDVLESSKTSKEKLTFNGKANTISLDELKLYIPEGYELVTDIKVSTNVNPYCDLYMKHDENDDTSKSNIKVCVAGNTLWDLEIEFEGQFDFNVHELFEKYNFKSVYNLFEYYMNHKDDRLNYFSKLDDIKLMYVLKLLFGGSENFESNYTLYTYDNTEILTYHMHDKTFNVNDSWDSTITLLTPREYRSYNVTIASQDNELSESDVKEILSSFETTLEKLD